MKDKPKESLQEKRGGNVRGMPSLYKMFIFLRTRTRTDTEEERTDTSQCKSKSSNQILSSSQEFSKYEGLIDTYIVSYIYIHIYT